MSEYLDKYIAKMDHEEAIEKTAALDELYGKNATIRELYNESLQMLTEKIASGELPEMGESMLVTSAARLAKEGYDIIASEIQAKEMQEKVAALGNEIEGVLKEAGVDLEEVLASGDPDYIEDAAELANELLKEKYTK